MALTKWPDDFHPASSKPIVNGEEATTEVAFRSAGDDDGQMMPWKNAMPMNTKRIR